MNVQRTIRIQLEPTPEQAAILLETLRQSAACFDVVCRYAWAHNERDGVELHRATYYDLKAQYPQMPAQLLCAARVKATETIRAALTLRAKGNRTSCPQSRSLCIRYDARSHRIFRDRGTVTLASIQGRQEVKFRLSEYAQDAFAMTTGFDSSDLLYRKSKWYLHVVLTFPDPEFAATGSVVGVDLGINRPAVTSRKKFLGKRRWREVQNRYFRLRRKLQSQGTKAAKRRLKRLSGRLRRFRMDCDHVLSKQIVEGSEPGTVIVVENLTGIRARVKQKGAPLLRRLHSWSFAQLSLFLDYKALAKGCRVEAVNPAHTSQRCSRCGHTARNNRPCQSVFRCRKCHYELNADLNGAINIAEKYLGSAGRSGVVWPLSDGLLSQNPATVMPVSVA